MGAASRRELACEAIKAKKLGAGRRSHDMDPFFQRALYEMWTVIELSHKLVA